MVCQLYDGGPGGTRTPDVLLRTERVRFRNHTRTALIHDVRDCEVKKETTPTATWHGDEGAGESTLGFKPSSANDSMADTRNGVAKSS